MTSKNIVNNDSTSMKKKPQPKKKPLKDSKKVHYGFLTFVLIICVIQAVRGVYLNIAKYIILNRQYKKLEALNNDAIEKNQGLKKEYKNYLSPKGVEALARDELKMVGPNEMYVEIMPPPKIEKKNKSAFQQIINALKTIL